MSAISALIIIIFVLFIILSAVLGFKIGARRSAYGLAANLICALSAFILSVILKKPLSTLLYRPLSQKITDRLDALTDNSVILTLTKEISISITSILLFAGIYLALRCICGICFLVKAIYKKEHSAAVNEEPVTDEEIDILDDSEQVISESAPKRLSASSLGGVIICIISFIISAIIVLFPLTGAINIVNNTLETAKEHSDSSRKYTSIQNKIEPLSNNLVLSGIYSCGGKILFNRFTQIDYEDSNVSLSDESKNMAVMYILFSVVRDESYANTPERIAAAESIKNVVNASAIIPDLSSELIQTAANSFIDKESFLGVHLPDSNDKIKSLYMDMLSTCAETSSDNIEESLDSFIDIWETMIRYDALDRIKNNETVLKLFADEGFLEDFFLEIYDDNNLKTFIPRIANTGLSIAFESINLPTDSITDNAISIDNMSREEVADEAVLLTRVISNLNEISSSIHSDNHIDTASLLSDTVDDLYDSYFFKQITQALLLSVITSYAGSIQ